MTRFGPHDDGNSLLDAVAGGETILYSWSPSFGMKNTLAPGGTAESLLDYERCRKSFYQQRRSNCVCLKKPSSLLTPVKLLYCFL